jgi:4-hydroxy-3-methylbut-2-enyl diphosphate reductase
VPKSFDIPSIYESPVIRRIKEHRAETDPMKKDMRPAVLDFGAVRFRIPRHFGFCYGVQNAIDIAYKTVYEHAGKRIFLLSEMIHNPTVNEDLLAKGVRFLFDTAGNELFPFDALTSDDIVIVPAFGTTLEMQARLAAKRIDPYQYDTTCPFVVKVWRRGDQLGKKGHALVIHGKYQHEETRATFSHAAKNGPAVVVFNVEEARILGEFMTRKRPFAEFEAVFGHKATPGFDPVHDLVRFGVINQTTMLATETQEVMDALKVAADEVGYAMADTSDTLCYATNENQAATYGLLEEQADVAVVVGGYNSSNTLHIVELLERKFPTYHIRDASEFTDANRIRHFDQWTKSMVETSDWLKGARTVAITSGASCPDSLVDDAILKIAALYPGAASLEEAMAPYSDTM